jgi:hypothetical protein
MAFGVQLEAAGRAQLDANGRRTLHECGLCDGPFAGEVVIDPVLHCANQGVNPGPDAPHYASFNAGPNPGMYRVCYHAGATLTHLADPPTNTWNQALDFAGLWHYFPHFQVESDGILLGGAHAPGSWNTHTAGYATAVEAEAASVGLYADIDATAATGDVIFKFWICDDQCDDNVGEITYAIKRL